MVWPLNVYYSLTPNGGGSTTQPPPNLARACPSLKKVFESRPTLPATVCKVASLHLKSKSFLRSMCKTDFHLFFRVFADDGLYRKNSEITFCVVVSLHFVRLSPNLVWLFFWMTSYYVFSKNSIQVFFGLSSANSGWLAWRGGGQVPTLDRPIAKNFE